MIASIRTTARVALANAILTALDKYNIETDCTETATPSGCPVNLNDVYRLAELIIADATPGK